MEFVLMDAAGHRRSPATMPGYHRGRPPRNKGELYPADPPTVEEIVAVMRTIGDRADGHRLRALIVLLWRAGLRISEALSLQESDLDRSRGAVLVRRGKGGKRREVGMDRWAWEHLNPWLKIRHELPTGALLCVIHGSTAGGRWEPSAARKQLHRVAAQADVRRRFAPHQLRNAHAVEMAHEGVPLVVIQRQLGHYAGDPVKRAERDCERERRGTSRDVDGDVCEERSPEVEFVARLQRVAAVS
ncbi:MAG: tyrosine-type recombinase/integrase [Solirubrobacteraceae bacterium]